MQHGTATALLVGPLRGSRVAAAGAAAGVTSDGLRFGRATH